MGYVALCARMDSTEYTGPIIEHGHDDDQRCRGELAQAAKTVETINSRQVLDVVRSHYESKALAEGKAIAIDPEAADVEFTSDRTLVERVLSNMLKNAIEASARGATIRGGCRLSQRGVAFSINNPSFMPRRIQLQVFQRSFSTKGPNRGIGTYSMKLLTERFLRGTVSFTSSRTT